MSDLRANKIIEHLKKGALADPAQEINEKTPLVSSGLIDSFSLVEILEVLEQVSGIRLPRGRIAPQDLDTVESMLALADHWAKPDAAGRANDSSS